MLRKISFLLLTVFICVSMSSCWNYRSITVLDIVSGIAIDKDDKSGLYQITMEIANVSSSGENSVESIYAVTEGTTLFDAGRNSKKKLSNKFFLGNMQVLIISSDLAKTEGIAALIDGILRDNEPRETMNIVISQEKTAKEVLCAKGLDTMTTSYEIRNIVENDNKITSSTRNTQLYDAYNAINGTGIPLILPAFRCVPSEDGEEKNLELNGVAFFNDDRLAGFLSPEDTKYILMLSNEAKGGAFNFNFREDIVYDVSAEIRKCYTKTSFDYHDQRLKISLSVDSDMKLIEMKESLTVTEEVKDDIEKNASETLKFRIEAIIKKAQNEHKIDIFGFENILYRDNNKLWKQLEKDWKNVFENADISVDAFIRISDTGIIRR